MTKENQIKLLKHYKELAETANGAIQENAVKHRDEILGNYPNIEEVKTLEKSKSSKKE